MQVIAPLGLLELALGWEFKDLLTSLEIGNNCSIVFAAAHNQAWVREAPREGKDTLVVDVVEGAAGVVRASQIPNID